MTKVTHLTLEDGGGLNRKRIHLREISGDADSPLETVGQDLRAARLRRGDDLATVSRALKIRKDHLEALEEDRFEALPGRTYAVGFVRSYADYLGLHPTECVERFKSEIAGRADAQPTVGPPPEPEGVRLPQGWVVIGIVMLALVAYGVYYLVRSADTLLHPPVAPVPAAIAPPPPTTMNSEAPPRRIAPAATKTAGAGVPAAQGAAVPGTPDAAAAVPGAQTTGTAAATTPSAPLPPGKAYGAEYHNARVVLRAHAASRVLIMGAGGVVYLNRVLQPGDSFNVPDRAGMTLTTPDGSAIAVELDGQLMGFAGTATSLAEPLSLDPQAIADRFSHSNPG